jgi:hypothetical protein
MRLFASVVGLLLQLNSLVHVLIQIIDAVAV